MQLIFNIPWVLRRKNVFSFSAGVSPLAKITMEIQYDPALFVDHVEGTFVLHVTAMLQKSSYQHSPFLREPVRMKENENTAY